MVDLVRVWEEKLELILRLAEELDLRVYPSACAANVDAHGLGCTACRLGPCGDTDKLPDVDEHSLRELSENTA
jgi:hypothetical protein